MPIGLVFFLGHCWAKDFFQLRYHQFGIVLLTHGNLFGSVTNYFRDPLFQCPYARFTGVVCYDMLKKFLAKTQLSPLKTMVF